MRTFPKLPSMNFTLAFGSKQKVNGGGHRFSPILFNYNHKKIPFTEQRNGKIL